MSITLISLLLLFPSNIEDSPIATAQAALLMSFWSSPYGGTKNPNTLWLGRAIHHAKEANADRFWSLVPDSLVQDKQANTLKRLWWCCIIRDRILALAVRRTLQIATLVIEPQNELKLTYLDVADEFDRSKVYDSKTKRHLARILEHQVELCIYLTDIIPLLSPIENAIEDDLKLHTDLMGKLSDMKAMLRGWRRRVKERIPSFEDMSLSKQCVLEGAIILHTDLLHIYYQ